jgi:anti-sigma-K factor RskA
MNDETNLFNLLPGYALGALSDEERTQVEAFLATSEAARAELRTYEAMLAGFATLAPARKAPPSLTDDFRSRLAAEHRGAEPPAPTKPVTAVKPFPVRRVLLGLAALLVLAVGLYAVYRQVIGDQEQRIISEILSNRSAQWITLNPQSGTPGKVSFVTVADRVEAVLVAEQLPRLPDEKQYQLWLLDAEGRDNGGVFSADQPVKQVLVRMPGLPKRYKKLGITVEPRGGSAVPTSPGVFSGEFPQSQ